MRVKLTWEIDDGYSGKSRPQTSYIDGLDWEDCSTEEEREALIEETIREDFLTNISWTRVGDPEIED